MFQDAEMERSFTSQAIRQQNICLPLDEELLSVPLWSKHRNTEGQTDSP
jgi:hypothetical protein